MRAESVRERFARLDHPVLCAAYRRKRYALFLMRTFCAVALYYLLWDFTWLRWTLIIYLPLNFIYFFSLVGWRYFLQRKLQRMQEGVG